MCCQQCVSLISESRALLEAGHLTVTGHVHTSDILVVDMCLGSGVRRSVLGPTVF